MSSKLIDALQTKDTVTENGAISHSTSGSALLDFFFSGAAMRKQTEKNIWRVFEQAFFENALDAMKILFWLRDIRNGAGERRVFRVICEHLANDPQKYSVLNKNLSIIPEFGRYDDLLYIFERTETKSIQAEIAHILYTDIYVYQNAICAKWLPRQGDTANRLRAFFSRKIGSTLTPKQYRKKIVELSKTVEQQMCSNQWDEINYSQVPSVAMKKYHTAFYTHSYDRMSSWVTDVKNGKSKVNASTLYPYDIIHSMLGNRSSDLYDEQWKALPNYVASETKFLPIVDVSGSMNRPIHSKTSVTCLDVAISLGLYLAERNTSIFKNAFITFSQNPTLEIIKGNTLFEKFKSMNSSAWGMNTNLEAVFELILNQAQKNNVPSDEMPTHILILSDMEFDACARLDKTNYETIKKKYKKAHYPLPNIVFWNIQSRNAQFPIKRGDYGTALISGCSPSILTAVLGNDIDPLTVMYNVINKSIYNVVSA